MKCKKCGQEIADGKLCTICCTPVDENTSPAGDTGDEAKLRPNNAAKPECKYSMKWYKFLLVVLCIAAIMNFSNGVMNITGHQYEGMADAVYAKFPGLKSLDVFYGFALLGLAALNVAAFAGLKEYKAYGPKALLIMYIANAAISAIYTYVAIDITGDTSMTANFTSIMVTIAFAVYNYRYFKEREDLFIY